MNGSIHPINIGSGDDQANPFKVVHMILSFDQLTARFANQLSDFSINSRCNEPHARAGSREEPPFTQGNITTANQQYRLTFKVKEKRQIFQLKLPMP